MAQVIIMAKKFYKRPSEILKIDDDYIAYCFDEVSLYIEGLAINKKGELDWDLINWTDDIKSNEKLIEFINSHR